MIDKENEKRIKVAKEETTKIGSVEYAERVQMLQKAMVTSQLLLISISLVIILLSNYCSLFGNIFCLLIFRSLLHLASYTLFSPIEELQYHI